MSVLRNVAITLGVICIVGVTALPTKSDIVPEADEFELVEAPAKPAAATSSSTKSSAIAKCVAAHTAALPANDIPYKKNVETAQLALSHAIEAEKVHTKMASAEIKRDCQVAHGKYNVELDEVAPKPKPPPTPAPAGAAGATGGQPVGTESPQESAGINECIQQRTAELPAQARRFKEAVENLKLKVQQATEDEKVHLAEEKSSIQKLCQVSYGKYVGTGVGI